MLIDLILDRKEGIPYSFSYFKEYCHDLYKDVYDAIPKGEDAVKKALCDYIDTEYNPEIKDYVMSVEWLTKPVKQILRTYREKMSCGFVERIPVSFDFGFCNVNENEGYAKTFTRDYARGVVNGMKCRWKHPLVVVVEVQPDGSEKEVDWWR